MQESIKIQSAGERHINEFPDLEKLLPFRFWLAWRRGVEVTPPIFWSFRANFWITFESSISYLLLLPIAKASFEPWKVPIDQIAYPLGISIVLGLASAWRWRRRALHLQLPSWSVYRNSQSAAAKRISKGRIVI